MKGGGLLIAILILPLFFFGCSDNTEQISGEGNRAIITDRTGRDWDVTYARDTYNMDPDFYNFGLGTGAINSIDNPILIKKGDPGYPEEDDDFLVVGVNHNGEQNAYSVDSLTRHEVYNDFYPGETDQYVAVTF